MIHPELCSACGGPLQLGAGLVSYMIRWHSIVGYSVVGYSRCWVFRTVTDDILLLGIPSLGIPLLGIPVILPGIPKDQNIQLFCWIFWSLSIPDVGYSVQLSLQQVNDSLSKMEQKAHTGFYRDDGLIYIEDANGPLLNRIEKALHRIFKGNKLSISLEQKGHEINFLNVTMDTEGTHKPYKKHNSKVTYVSKASNHPPSITMNFPKSIGKRLNTISSSEAEFNNAKDDYQNALSEAGYSDELSYNLEQWKPTRVNKKRKRSIVWFNPPYSRNVATNIGKEFFNLLGIHFPTQHPLHRLFNRNSQVVILVHHEHWTWTA